jgi:hypothetical protein
LFASRFSGPAQADDDTRAVINRDVSAGLPEVWASAGIER